MQLVVLSERIVHAMADSDTDLSVDALYGTQVKRKILERINHSNTQGNADDFLATILFLQLQIHLMCDAYLTYMTGLPDALRVCNKLRENAEFLEIMRTLKCHMTIEDFLERPVKV